MLTTFRKSGELVSTPVWIAREGGELLVITPTESGKVKRKYGIEFRAFMVVEFIVARRRKQRAILRISPVS